jgi:hypothetical protein
MTRRSLAVVVLAVALLVAFVVALLHRPGQAAVRLGGRPVSIQKTLSPREPSFGDTVTATVDVVVDRRRADVPSVRVRGRFAPYRIVSSRRTERRLGATTTVRVEERLQCLDLACVPPRGTGTLRFPAVEVSYVAGQAPATLRSPWPALRLHSRVMPVDLQRPFFRVPPARRAPVDYRVPPRAAGIVLLVLSALLALAGAATLLRVGLPAALRSRPRVAPALERILHELAAASSNGDSGRRRRALEHLARELEPVDASLSAESRVLAWAPDDPRPEAIADLTSRIAGMARR